MPKLLSVMVIIVSITLIIALIQLISSIVEYKWCIDEKCAAISFDEFLSFYRSAPNKWRFCADHLEYSRSGSGYSIISEEVYFKSYFDFRKYKRWNKKKQKDQCTESRNKRLLELSKLWSQDINIHYQSSMDEILAMYQGNISLSKKYEENLERVKKKYKIHNEDIVSYSIDTIDGARIIKTKDGSSVRIPMYELTT